MRHVLIDAARARQAAKRSGIAHSFDEAIDSLHDGPPDAEVLRLGEALELLARLDANLAQVIDCRFFARMDERETADVMGVSDRTVRRWWVQARAFIHREMQAG
jgi:DNA-directed RNA polymerase specialized sigma24 family protein